MGKLNKVLRGLIYALPMALIFSYYPVMTLGADKTMNFELSVPLLWIVIFDAVALAVLVREKLIMDLVRKWQWLVFPVFVTLTLIWSVNLVRGILTVGVMWLLYFAVFAMVKLGDSLSDESSKKTFWKWFFGASILACVWCAVQCILDVVGVPREGSLLCAGCTSLSFGFPHPNGFAIEPQFMGNLLLAPVIITAWMLVEKNYSTHGLSFKFLIFCFLIFVATLFLTFSRGAIYAFVVAMMFLTALMIARAREKERGAVGKRAGMAWGLTALMFLFTLNLQGILTEVGPTNDTYYDGVAKALNHLSLGVIDIRQEKNEEKEPDFSEETQALQLSVEEKKGNENEAIFDGYVEESTNVRMTLTHDALLVWSQDLKTVLFGVGIGGAGQALFDAGLTESPKEIVQNEYASLLLEIGLVGVICAIVLLVMVIKMVIKNPGATMILTLGTAYGVSLLFFSGLANALQIYLTLAVFYMVLRKKLVS